MLRDLPLDELRRYRPPVEEPADFDEFWASELAAAAASAAGPVFAPAQTQIQHAGVFDVPAQRAPGRSRPTGSHRQ